MLPSALVMTNGSPTGRHPWETTAATSTFGPSTTPTAPSPTTCSSMTRRLPPGATPADASPPTTGTPGRTSLSCRTTSSAGKVNGSASTRMADASPTSGHPATALPSDVGTTRAWNGVTGPVCPAHTAMAGRCSTSRAPPTTDSAVQPSRVRGLSVARTAAAMSSMAPRCGAVTKSRARSGGSSAAPRASRTWPTASPVAWVGTGCSESPAPKLMSVDRFDRWQQGEGDDRRVPGVDAAVGLDRAVVLVRELTTDERVPELARFDLERLRVARHFFPAGIAERRLQRALTALVGRAAHEHDQVRSDGHRDRLVRGEREHDSREVDARRRSGYLPQVDVLDEQGRHDLHSTAQPTASPVLGYGVAVVGERGHGRHLQPARRGSRPLGARRRRHGDGRRVGL